MFTVFCCTYIVSGQLLRLRSNYTDCSLNRAGNCLNVLLHLLLGFGLNHNSRQWLGAGVANYYSSAALQVIFSLTDCRSHDRDLFERLLLADSYILNKLREYFEVGNQFIELLSSPRDDVEHYESGQKSVS